MLNKLDNFYLEKEEPIKSCLLALREIILSQDNQITNVLKYGMPFFCYKGKMFCYLWVHKKYNKPYIGIVEGNRFDYSDLIIEKRSRMKIMLIDANEDLPIETIEMILKKAIELYKTGQIKI
jgi:Domain of unknown function (DU1801)